MSGTNRIVVQYIGKIEYEDIMEPSVVTAFTPLASLLGGLLIGISSLAVMFFFGRIAGISGITSTLIQRLGAAQSPDWLWRVFFIAGLISAPLLLKWSHLDFLGEGTSYPSTVSSNYIGMAVAGLLVGVGTVMGSGCTSGHGVCGLGRLSSRSLVAVLTFMLSAVVTVAVIRHVI